MDDQNNQQSDQVLQSDSALQGQDQQAINQPAFDSIPAEVKIYLETILEEADLLIVTEEEREQVLQNMYRQLDMFLLNTIIENLPEDKIEEFTTIDEENPNPEKIQSFLQKEIPNTQEIMQKAFEEFREMYLDTIAAEEARMDAVLEDQTNTPTLLLEKLKYQDQIPSANS